MRCSHPEEHGQLRVHAFACTSDWSNWISLRGSSPWTTSSVDTGKCASLGMGGALCRNGSVPTMSENLHANTVPATESACETHTRLASVGSSARISIADSVTLRKAISGWPWRIRHIQRFSRTRRTGKLLRAIWQRRIYIPYSHMYCPVT